MKIDDDNKYKVIYTIIEIKLKNFILNFLLKIMNTNIEMKIRNF